MYSLAIPLATVAAIWGSGDVKRTSTSRLLRTGETTTLPRNASMTRDCRAVSTASGWGGFGGDEKRPATPLIAPRMTALGLNEVLGEALAPPNAGESQRPND